jgi:hypothetical protein
VLKEIREREKKRFVQIILNLVWFGFSTNHLQQKINKKQQNKALSCQVE